MITYVLVLLVVLYFLQRKSLKNPLKGLSYDYTVDKKLVEVEEGFVFSSVITNASSRFVSFVGIIEIMPKVTILTEGVKLNSNRLAKGLYHHDSTTYMHARSQLNRSLDLAFTKRGCHVFHGGRLYAGDFLGFKEKDASFNRFETVIVYPKVINCPELGQMIGGFLGDVSVRRFIMEDPILTIGVRPYTEREPMKQFSWKHTAKTGEMMVKQYDYTTESKISIILDVSGEESLAKQVSDDLYETCYSLATTVARRLDQAKMPFEFLTNAIIEGHLQTQAGGSKVAHNLGKKHLQLILEKIGRGGYGAAQSYDALLQGLEDAQEKGTNQSLIIITPTKNPEKLARAKKMQEKFSGQLLMLYGEAFMTEGLAGEVS